MSFNKETGMYEGYIYCITNQINGKKYIGQTTLNVESRWKQHKYRSTINKYNQPLYNAFNKYGIDNFTVKQIKKMSNHTKDLVLQDLNYRERYYIDFINSLVPNGYNVTIGGDFNPTCFTCKEVTQLDIDYNVIAQYDSIREASRQTCISDARISRSCHEYKMNYNEGFLFCFNEDLNYVLSNKPYINLKRVKTEKPAKIKKTKKTIKIEKSKRIPKVICQYDLKGNLIKKYNSITKLLKENNLTSSGSIYMACDGVTNSSHGFLWTYDGQIPPKYKEQYKSSMKRVLQFDLDFNYINTYNSLAESAKSVGLKQYQSISAVCRGKTFKSAGYIWRFEDNLDKLLYEKHMGYDLPVDQYDLNNNYIKSYKTIIDAANDLNLEKSKISRCCKHNISKHGGFMWKYPTENKGGVNE